MSQNNSPTLDGITKMTLLISMYIRSVIEGFHSKHLSDAQMKELNPIIRQDVYNILVFLKLAETDEPSSYKLAAQKIIDFQKLLLPAVPHHFKKNLIV